MVKKIPKEIEYETPSEEAICMHEAGHASAALVVGLAPNLIELLNDPGSPGRARNSIPRGNQQQRRLIACAAYSVEYSLYKAGRLINVAGAIIDEPTFIRLAVGRNAACDKVNFFDADRSGTNGSWPREDDQTFVEMGQGLGNLLPLPLVIELAEALLNERHLDCNRIVEIAVKHLPGSKDNWICPEDGSSHPKS